MIARLWRGETRSEDADAYQQVLESTGVRDYRATPGNQGVWLLRREQGARTEFALLTLWDSHQAIEAFAGKDIGQARYCNADAAYLLDFRKTVDHFDVAGVWDQAPVAEPATQTAASPTCSGFNQFEAVAVAQVEPVQVGPGCQRRDLPATAGLRAWTVDMAPGAVWPWVDDHPTGELVMVLEGEMIEGERRLGPGTWLHFPPGSAHRPRTEAGVRLVGINPVG